MIILLCLACLAAGLLIGFLAAKAKLAVLETRAFHLTEERDRLALQAARVLELEKDLSREEADRVNLEERIEGHQKELADLQRQLTTQFENLAHQILEKNSERLRESSERNLQVLLNPLKERIKEFQDKVEKTYNNESREMFHLKEEIKKIVEVNEQMTKEASNLTKALKGDSKSQGNWGEIVLERVLQASGLREGEEYTTQGRDMGLETEDGQKQKPDVIVKLPDNKHIIVDSKVTLTAFERLANSEDKDGLLKEFHASVYKHIDELSAKHYQTLDKLHSPDFVLLFMPIEAAFSTALQTDGELFPYAWGKRIVLVSPTTLLATLRTVASLWKTERQNKNAVEIARQGGALYDKFVLFVGDLEKIGKNIGDTQRSYDEALSKLREGAGNLVSRAEKLRELGAKTAKQLPEN